MWYIHSEDLAAGLTGPFPDLVEVQKHLDFMHERGDAGVLNENIRILTEVEARKTWAWNNNRGTAEEDRNFDMTLGGRYPLPDLKK